MVFPAFNDNCIWMLHDGHSACVIDPGDPEPVLAALQKRGLELAAILVTHHHGDHTGGVSQLLAQCRGAQVFAPSAERMPFVHQDADALAHQAFLGLRWQVLHVPGHTAGHVAYRTSAVTLACGTQPILFCGDTLFSAGCGRLFEGSPAQMHASLEKLNAGPAETLVCCAHEYTLSNLRFALAVEPGNATTLAHQAHCKHLRASGHFTLPSRLALEREINPFLRTASPSVIAAVQQRQTCASDAVSVFTALRAWKDVF